MTPVRVAVHIRRILGRLPASRDPGVPTVAQLFDARYYSEIRPEWEQIDVLSKPTGRSNAANFCRTGFVVPALTARPALCPDATTPKAVT